MLDLSFLSSEQREVVLSRDGPILVLAGPGSGKTTLLAARVAYLVVARAVPPSSVLALTFTTRAARELRERLAGVIGGEANSVDVTTFHALGLRIIRHWAGHFGFGTRQVSVYDESRARSLIRELADGLGLDPERWPVGALPRLLESHRLSDAPIPLELATLALEYRETLRRRHAVDYAEMLTLPLELFRRVPRALALYQDAYRHVLGDEFQDVNAPQYQMLRLLALRHRNLVVVGDPAQTVFGWRGADVRFSLDFQRDFPEVRVFSLRQSYRSTARIVALANRVGRPLGYSRVLWTENALGEPPRLRVARDERSEADFVGSEIRRLLDQGALRLGEVAILYRVNWQLGELSLALRRRHLAYQVLQSTDFFHHREVEDVLAYLRLARDPGDADALARVVNVPPRRLGRLERELRRSPIPLEHLPARASRFGEAAERGAESLARVVGELHGLWQELPSARLVDLVLQRTGYSLWLEGLADGKARLARVMALRSLAEGSRGELLDEIALGEGGLEEGGPDVADRVTLSTIHGAKGGEWKVVFVVGVEEGLLPHAHSLHPADRGPPESRVGAEPTGSSTVPDASSLEEELRVRYVAVTRARERLYLTYPRTRRRGERVYSRSLSRFLRSLPPDVLVRGA